MSEARCSFQCDGTLGHAGAHYLYRDGVHSIGLAAPAPPAPIDVERLARALYESALLYEADHQAHPSTTDWDDLPAAMQEEWASDAAAIARAYAGEEDVDD